MKVHGHLLPFALSCALATGCAAAAEGLAEAPTPRAATAAPAEAALTVDGLLDNMETARKGLKTFSAAVAKTRRLEALEDTEEFSGAIEFKTPRLLKMSLTSARSKKETVTFVGKEYAWIWRVQDKQAERGRLADLKEADKKKTANPLEYGLARDVHGLQDAYDLTLLPREKAGEADAVPLELTPKKETYAEGKTILWIDARTWLPVQVREYKSNDEIVETHTFTDIKTNVSMSDRMFEFDPPKDVDVILHDAGQEK